MARNPPASAGDLRRGSNLVREDPLGEGEGQPTPVFLLRISWREKPAGYSPQGPDADTTEVTSHACMHTGEDYAVGICL